MINGIFTAFSGMIASAKKLHNSSNNLLGLGGNKVTVGDNLGSKFNLSSSEASKVDISNEMVNQITAQAAFTANAKVIVVSNETTGKILDIKS